MRIGRYSTLFQTIPRAGFGAATLLACCALGPTLALAQAPDDIDVSACLEVESPLERLDCFETRTAEMLRARESGQHEAEQQVREQRAPEQRTNLSPAAAAHPAASAAGNAVASNEAAEPVAEAPDESAEMSRSERRALRRAEARQREAEAAAAAARAVAEAPDLIVATVTEVREIEPNMLLITLDNGQVWKQNRPQFYRLTVGAEVELRPSRWGSSYRLTDPNLSSFIQVERRQ
jgi:hypothetical protein